MESAGESSGYCGEKEGPDPWVSAVRRGLGQAARTVASLETKVEALAAEEVRLPGWPATGSDVMYAYRVPCSGTVSGECLFLADLDGIKAISSVLAGIEFSGDRMVEITAILTDFVSETLRAACRILAVERGATVAPEQAVLMNPEGRRASLADQCSHLQAGAGLRFRVQAASGRWFPADIFLERSLIHGVLQLASDGQEKKNDSAHAPDGMAIGRETEGSRNRTDRMTAMTNQEAAERNPNGNWNIDLILDVELPIVVSFGETEMQLKDILKLGVGSVIELDKSVNDPVTIVVNQKPIAKGEVVMVEGNYGVRIMEVESTGDRIRSLG